MRDMSERGTPGIRATRERCAYVEEHAAPYAAMMMRMLARRVCWRERPRLLRVMMLLCYAARVQHAQRNQDAAMRDARSRGARRASARCEREWQNAQAVAGVCAALVDGNVVEK